MADLLNVLARLDLSHCTRRAQLVEVEHVPIEGALDELADCLLVDQLVVKVFSLRLRIEVEVSRAGSLSYLLG